MASVARDFLLHVQLSSSSLSFLSIVRWRFSSWLLIEVSPVTFCGRWIEYEESKRERERNECYVPIGGQHLGTAREEIPGENQFMFFSLVN